jgi:hypothetical protein
VGDNLIMLDKRTDSGGGSHSATTDTPAESRVEGFPSTDAPIGDPGDLPY